MAPPTPAEEAALERVIHRSCSPALGLLWPGLGQLCQGRPGEGAALAVMGAAEVAAGVALWAQAPVDDPLSGGGSMVPLVAFQDAVAYGYGAAILDTQRARRLTHVPLDTTEELLGAPFNLEVMRRPEVWGGLIGLTGGALALTWLLDDPPTTRPDRVNLFGAELAPAVGYPLAAASGVVLFEHVALAEEVLFRGLLQSSLVRATGNETTGWLLASLIFGAIHATNALMLPPEDRLSYLAISLPYITVTGSYLGLVYRWTDYSLAAPVAIHFWYDLTLVGVEVATSPGSHMFSAGIGGSF